MNNKPKSPSMQAQAAGDVAHQDNNTLSAKGVNLANIPSDLKDLRRWVNWKRWTDAKGKIKKVPYQVTGSAADSSDSQTWNTFDACVANLRKMDGMGFTFTAEDGFFGLDVDHCIDEDGETKEWAIPILEMFAHTYTERSPGGDGLHIIGRGVPIVTGERKHTDDKGVEQGIELYKEKRYFTVTGNRINKAPIADCQDALDWLYGHSYADDDLDTPRQADRSRFADVDVEVVRAALACIPSDNRADWIKIGHALKATDIDFEVYDEWSAKSDKYDADDTWKKWNGFKPTNISIGTVFYIAKRHGFKMPSRKSDTYSGQYRIDDDGVWFVPTSDQGESDLWICSKINIVAAVCDESGNNWGRLLEFDDAAERHHTWCMPMEMLRGSGEEYRGALLSMGVRIAPGVKARNHLTTYIQTTVPKMLGRCVTRTGWVLLEDKENDQ
jgi:hypothetical protein